MKVGYTVVLVSALLTLILVAPAISATYTVTLKTDLSSYSGTQTVHISGNVSPSPGPNQAVTFKVTGPGGASYPLPPSEINATTGSFSATFVTGGPYYTSSGTYTIIAGFGLFSGNTTFTYAASATSTTSTTSTTTSSSSSSSTSTTSITSSTTASSSTSQVSTPSTSSSTTSTSSTSLSSSTEAVPAFPFQATLVVIVTLVMVMAYLIVRHRSPKTSS